MPPEMFPLSLRMLGSFTIGCGTAIAGCAATLLFLAILWSLASCQFHIKETRGHNFIVRRHMIAVHRRHKKRTSIKKLFLHFLGGVFIGIVLIGFFNLGIYLFSPFFHQTFTLFVLNASALPIWLFTSYLYVAMQRDRDIETGYTSVCCMVVRYKDLKEIRGPLVTAPEKPNETQSNEKEDGLAQRRAEDDEQDAEEGCAIS